MIPFLSLLAIVLQLAVQRETPPLSLQIYSQGTQVGTESASVVMEITNRSKHPVTLWKSPVFPVLKSEIGPATKPAADTEPIYRLLVVYDRAPTGGQQIVQAEGGNLFLFQQVTLAPGETMYAKTTLSRYMVGQHAKVWVETSGSDTVSRSNELEFEAAPAK
jgi:hypothetical protein